MEFQVASHWITTEDDVGFVIEDFVKTHGGGMEVY